MPSIKRGLFSHQMMTERQLRDLQRLTPMGQIAAQLPNLNYSQNLPFLGTDDDLGAMLLFEIKMHPRISRSLLYRLYLSRQLSPSRLNGVLARILESGFIEVEYPEYMFPAGTCPPQLRGDSFFTFIGELNGTT